VVSEYPLEVHFNSIKWLHPIALEGSFPLPSSPLPWLSGPYRKVAFLRRQSTLFRLEATRRLFDRPFKRRCGLLPVSFFTVFSRISPCPRPGSRCVHPKWAQDLKGSPGVFFFHPFFNDLGYVFEDFVIRLTHVDVRSALDASFGQCFFSPCQLSMRSASAWAVWLEVCSPLFDFSPPLPRPLPLFFF